MDGELEKRWLELRGSKRKVDWDSQTKECKVSIETLQQELLTLGGKMQGFAEEMEAAEQLVGVEGTQLIVARCQKERQDIGAKIQETQRKLGAAKMRQADLLDGEPKEIVTEEERFCFLDELVAIHKLPAVASMAIDNDGKIIASTTAIVACFASKRIDLGDYRIEVTTRVDATNEIRVCIVRRSGEAELHPYNIDGKGSFCFGVRRSQLEALHMRGRYRELLQLIIECIHHINSGDNHKVEGLYYKELGNEELKGIPDQHTP